MVTTVRQFAAQIVLTPSVVRLLVIAALALVVGPNAPIGGGGGVG
jgi:hypothetical protein